jgi:hypothetical protein
MELANRNVADAAEAMQRAHERLSRVRLFALPG